MIMEEESVKRGANFTKVEIDMLVDIVFKYKDVVENKRTDATTWADKNNAWMSITKELNATCGNFNRSAKTVRAKYEAVKKNLRKKCSLLKNEQNKTGGGISSSPDLHSFEEKILSVTQLSMIGLPSRFDKDVDLAVPGPSQEVDDIVCDMTVSHDEDVADYLRRISNETSLKKDGLGAIYDNNVVDLQNETLQPVQQEAAKRETATRTLQDPFIHKGKRLKRQNIQQKKHDSKPSTEVIQLKKEVLQLQKKLLEEEGESKKTINKLIIDNLQMDLSLKKLKYKILQGQAVEKDGYMDWIDDDDL